MPYRRGLSEQRQGASRRGSCLGGEETAPPGTEDMCMTGQRGVGVLRRRGRAVRLRGAGSGGHCKYQASKRLGKRKVSALILKRWLADGRGMRHCKQLERNSGNQ